MPKGTLIIAGGALSRHASEVFGQFVEAAGGPGKQFAVLAAATAEPERSYGDTRSRLVSCGVDAAQISLLPVSGAVQGWERGAWEGPALEQAERADGIWIPGGDQNAVMRLLVDNEGHESPLLAIMRRRLADGAAIGGTSAGAALMSDPMIGAGTSAGALGLPRAWGEADAEISAALRVTHGLGFFPFGIVDQHFNTRARLGRLVEAAFVEDGARRPAFGVAEDSAMVCDLGVGRVSVVGEGGLYLVDVRGARRSMVGGKARYRDILLGYLTQGDIIELPSCRIEAPGKTPLETVPPAFALPRPVSSGVLSPYGSLAEFVGRLLLDNEPAGLREDGPRGFRYVRSFLFEEQDAGLSAWEIRLGRREALTKAWFGSDGGSGVGLGIGFEGVIVDILPARAVVEVIEDE